VYILWVFGVNKVENSQENPVDTAFGDVGPSTDLASAAQSDAETRSAGSPRAGRTGGDALVRRRFAATGIDLAAFCAGAYLLSHAGWMFVAAAVVLFLVRDWAEGYSPGKRIFELAAFDPHGRRCTLRASVLRNVPLVSPLLIAELALLLFSKRAVRLGDLLASTVVRRRSQPALATTTQQAEEASATEISGGSEEEARQNPQAEAAGAEAADSLIIDAGLLTPESLTSAPSEVIAQPHHHEGPTDPLPQASCASPIDPREAALCLGIEGEVTDESLDDAYWKYVGRYSPDATENLPDDELRARCAELASAKAGISFALPPLADEDPDRSACLRYLNDWFVVINKCRDALS